MRASIRPGKTALLAALLLAAGLPGLSAEASAQDRPPGVMRKATGSGFGKSGGFRTPAAVDVLHYDVNLRLGIVDGSLGGKVSVRLRTLAGAVVLHAALLEIDSARVNGASASVSAPSAEMIRLESGTPFGPGDTLTVDLWYRRRPELRRPVLREGYYWFSKDSLPGLPASVGYTVSEPSDARFWLPCHDEPFDKATADLSITVPQHVVAASNGRFTEKILNGDGTATWRWRERNPIAPYLLCVTASEFTVSTVPFVRATGDTIPLQYFVWREDSATCAAFLPTVRTMMQVLSSRFGPYPFDKYGMTAVVPFAFGGMEHQSITTMHRALKTDTAVVVHELAHQWWGNLVTCAAWEDIWLNEGFASYCEVLWEESIGGRDRRNAYLNTSFSNFSSASWEGAIYDPESQGFDLFSVAVYTKAAWVLHTLRGVLGDSLFFESLRAYRAQYAGGNATTDDFREVVESVSGRNLSGFFRQWIYGRGWPEYRYDWRWHAGELRIAVHQVQPDGFWPAYTMPIQFRASFGLADTLLVLQDSIRSQEFTIPMPVAPVLVEFDPFNWILKRVTGPVTAVQAGDVPETYALEQNYPNPFNGETEIGFRIAEPSEVTLTVFDLLAREVATLVRGRYDAGVHSTRFDASHLASGVYICRLSAGGSSVSRKMILTR